jgi:hypothetical protein
MFHKKCPTSEVFLELMLGFPCFFFVLYIIDVFYVLNYEFECLTS